VSRGYVVLAPDISYEEGKPGKSAYDYIVSGAEALAKNPWIDRSNMAITRPELGRLPGMSFNNCHHFV